MSKVVPIDGGRVRLPGPRDRIVNVGRTGSGKTYGGMWHLSNANFDVRPFILIDPKTDENIEALETERMANEIALDEKLPKHPGFYIVRPLPTEDGLANLDALLMRVWERENIGLYFDEGYMQNNGAGFVSCLTQGRSKRIQMIINTQRPAFISRYIFSEASFIQTYSVIDERDKKTIRNFAPLPNKELPEFWSYYYDVSWNKMYAMKPVPKMDKILDMIAEKFDGIQTRRRL